MAQPAGRRFWNLPVFTLVAMSFMLGMSEFIVVGILPDIARGLSVSEVAVGNLVSIFAFVYAPATPIGSALSGRFPRFPTHMALIVVFILGNVLCAVATNFAFLVVARMVIALVSGTLVAMSMTYSGEVTDPEHRTKFIAWVFSGFSLASVAGVPVGTWLAGVCGWRWTFWLIVALSVVLMILMIIVLPRSGQMQHIGFIAQFKLFFDPRIDLGVAAVLCGAAASYVFYTYLTPIMRDEIHLPKQYLSVGLVVFGLACLWSNLYGGKLANRGKGVEPLARIRPIYVAQTVCLCALPLVHFLPWLGVPLLIALGMLMYLQNSASQVLYMDVAESSHPGCLNLASSLNSMSFNIGIALGSAVGGLVNGALGLTWLGPFAAVFGALAVVVTCLLRRYIK
ncbi:MFS transporter [Bifidobacterium sp. ESL0784]|uniref:MFS transporter n=1 Tax=Bifidobacterium sp. ESL0784 TaxID=2983231 RepID=UPI0023F7D13F|nr:MFS transporter [Bifidobacterium sp. ESL0784]MDF7641213.1 MFS transporter [Bifidobacterium sp. ESL0784]